MDAEAVGQQQYEAFSSLFDAAGADTIVAACGRLLTRAKDPEPVEGSVTLDSPDSVTG
ncbi:hypothetical protein [Microlunatus soli]|uniref:hypothetical protein n=1 Tax=Microlunatus soli TaxID=630515 RepID=UPI0012FAA6EE|nr:hypothetical protein [Microlunatus soli]